jgi:hypothetical protein
MSSPPPTNPYYTVDFGDNSPVYKGIYINSFPTFTITHAFKRSGIYSVNITLFNKVSNKSQIFNVNYIEILI